MAPGAVAQSEQGGAMMTDLGDLANCPGCGKPTLGPIFSKIAAQIGVSEERLLEVMKKQPGFLGFACKDCAIQAGTERYLGEVP